MIATDRSTRRRARHGVAAAAFAVALVITATTACAKVKIEGGREALRVAAENVTVADVLAALAAAYPIRTDATAPLDTPARERLAGSLTQVLSALLDGYDYAIWTERDWTRVIVSGRSGERAIVRPPPPPVPNITQKWR